MMKQTGTGAGALGRLVCRCSFLCGFALLSSTWTQVAWAEDEAPTKASCAQAYESAQETRASGHLQETRQRLSFCAKTECPGFVQKDCARWLEEVDRELPSIVITPSGLTTEEAAQVGVKIDGQLISGALSGAALSVDPGPHELVLERPGHPPIHRSIMAQQGVQNRPIEIAFGGQDALAGAAPSDALDDSAGGSSSELRPYAYAAWSVGAVGLGVFAVLGTLGRADERGLKEECPTFTLVPADVTPGVCLQSTIDRRKSGYEREFMIADIGLATGIVGAAAGTVLFIMSVTDASAPESGDELQAARGLRWDVSPTPGGAFASVETSF
jgi:hypothetical protein